MADDGKNRRRQDRSRIDINQDCELRDWAKKLNVTPERLRRAVEAVGTQATRVQQYLADEGGKDPSS